MATKNFESSIDEIKRSHKKLFKYFSSGKTKSYDWRIAQLKALLEFIQSKKEDIVAALKNDMGRSAIETTLAEVMMVENEIKEAIYHLKDWMKPVVASTPALMAPSESEIIFEPFGVCLVIGPSNYPITLTIEPLVGAIAAGNCAIIKPSELTPCSEKILAELGSYLDKEAFSVICGAIETTSALLDLYWDKIFFTGSVRVGKIIARKAADMLIPVTLELGGKTPTIIDESTADLETAVKRILWGKCCNAGQTCVAPDYVLCHEKIYDEFLDVACRTLKTFYGEDASQSPDFSRLVNIDAAKRLQKALNDSNGTIVYGGKVVPQDRYVEPTLVKDITDDCSLMTQEIFGPILPIFKVKNMDEVTSFVNRPEFMNPLALYVFTNKNETIDKLLTEIPSGGFVSNDCLFHFSNSSIPFGGRGYSGNGGYHGFFSFECFSHRRAVMKRNGSHLLDVSVRYPPYTKTGLAVIRTVMQMPNIPSINFKFIFTKVSYLVLFNALALCIWFPDESSAVIKRGWSLFK